MSVISTPALTRHFAQRNKVATITIHLSRKQLATGRIESARQIVGRVNKAKGGEKENRVRARECTHSRGRGRRWKDEGGSAEGSGREDECRYVSFVVATKESPGGFANRNRRPWSVYEFPQLATGDKQIASYFCIQRLNGRRVWNEAPARYKRPLLANIGGERHARRIPALSSPGRVRALPLTGALASRKYLIAKCLAGKRNHFSFSQISLQ